MTHIDPAKMPEFAAAVGSLSGFSNAALVEQFRRQDENAFAELFRRHRELVYSVCWRWLGHHQDAEDVMQETFRRLASSIDRWDSRRPLEPWLAQIAGNRCRTFLSRRRDEVTGVDWSGLTPADQASPSEATLRSELDHAIERLPADTRRAFELVHTEGWSYEQVAQHTGHPVGTIKVWVHRARLRLIEELSPPSFDDDEPRRPK